MYVAFGRIIKSLSGNRKSVKCSVKFPQSALAPMLIKEPLSRDLSTIFFRNSWPSQVGSWCGNCLFTVAQPRALDHCGKEPAKPNMDFPSLSLWSS